MFYINSHVFITHSFITYQDSSQKYNGSFVLSLLIHMAFTDDYLLLSATPNQCGGVLQDQAPSQERRRHSCIFGGGRLGERGRFQSI